MSVLRVTNIQRNCVLDGSGVRTVVFLKGCMLSCPWCCNPETIEYCEQWYINDNNCLYLNGKNSKLCKQCVRLGGHMEIKDCIFGVAESTSRDYDVEELLLILLKDVELYTNTGGGVTFSGGEPLLQSEKLLPLLKELKQNGVSIAFETTLVAPNKNFHLLLNYIDSWIIDLKLQSQMFLFDRCYIDSILDKIRRLIHKDVIYRLVFFDKMFGDKDKILDRLQELDIVAIEILLCHNLGRNKYRQLSLDNECFVASKDVALSFMDYLQTNNITVNLLTV